MTAYNQSITPSSNTLTVGDKFAVYGTLREGCGNYEALRLGSRAKFIGKDTVDGILFGLHGGYPGLVAEHPEVDTTTVEPVVVEIYEIVEPTLGQSLDGLEGYYFERQDASLYLRAETTPHTLQEPVEIYYYNRDFRVESLIESGDWTKR